MTEEARLRDLLSSLRALARERGLDFGAALTRSGGDGVAYVDGAGI
jgi:hypothetical protein